MIDVKYYDEVVSVVNSHEEERPEYIDWKCKLIVNDAFCPECISARGWRSLSREWKAHNLLYKICYQRERTCTVDFDVEPWYRRLGYFFLAGIYEIII